MDTLPLEPFLHQENNHLYINCKSLSVLLNIRQQEIYLPHRINFFCLILYIEGEGQHIIDNKIVDTKPEHILIISKNQISQFIIPNDSAKVLIFSEDFFCLGDIHFQFFQTTQLFNLSADLALINVSNLFKELIVLFDFIEKELDRNHHENQQYLLNNYLFSILLLIEKEIGGISKNLHIKQEKLIVLRFKVLVNEKLDKSMTVKDYALILRMGIRTLEYAFKKVEGITPYAWLTERFIMEIKRCLLHKNLALSEIAYELGFKEPNHLTVFFKKQTSITPTQYKNKLKKSNNILNV